MLDVLHREGVYLWYYFQLQLSQIFRYWVLGMVLGSAVSVFAKERIHGLFRSLRGRRLGAGGILIASALGIASPLCMYGTIPLAASFSESGVEDDWLAAFMMSSVLLNPQLILYSMALGRTALAIRVLASFLCGAGAGLLVRAFYREKRFFTFTGFSAPVNRDTDPNFPLRFLKNLGRNLRATGPMFLLGVALSALFQRYVPAGLVASLFGDNEGFGVLMAATIGVPLYACGGGTIPLLQAWLADGMSMGSAAAFMITGPSTKITNLGAVKILAALLALALLCCACSAAAREEDTPAAVPFDEPADVVILDENGSMSLPVSGGTRLTENLVGEHFADYDSYLVLSHFKGHAMAGYGGAIKNISIGLGSAEGKCWIHSGGTSRTSPWGGDQTAFTESMAEASKSVSDYLGSGERIVYVNVMNRLSIDCDCDGNPAEPDLHDIGILASADPVALDQACIDLVYAQKDGDGASLVSRIESRNGLHTLEHAEEIGLGSRQYTLVSVDD